MTNFFSHLDTFKVEVISFGLLNAPPTLQRMMYYVFCYISVVSVSLEDIVVLYNFFEEHIGHFLSYSKI